MPVSTLPVNSGVTDFSPLGRRFVFTQDNNGRFFIVDTQRNIRYATGGTTTGSYNAAVQLYGAPLTGVFLTGFQERDAVEAFGGPNGMERVIAGQIRNPLTGRFVSEDQTDVLEDAVQITTGAGEVLVPPGDQVFMQQAPEDIREPMTGTSDAFARIEQILRSLDLGALIPFAEQQVRQGVTSDQFLLNLRNHEVFRDRFGVIFDLEDDGVQLVPGGGLVEQVKAVMQYEQQARDLLEDLPGRFRQTDFIHDLMRGRVSAQELALRIDEGYAEVQQSSPEVRQAFADFFGASGDDALAAYFLDPENAEDALLEEIGTAQIAGAGAMFGFDVERDMAERLGDFGFTFDQSRQGFGQAAQLRPLTRETISETVDLGDEELIGAGFGTDPDAADALDLRRRRRVADFAGGGGAAVGQQGAFGIGSAGTGGA